MINGIKGNTISEADAKKKLNELNEIKKVEIKGKQLIESQKKLLNLFDDLKTIFNVNESESENENENENKRVNENENESVNENGNESINKNEGENESENERENIKDEYYYKIKQLHDWFKTIDQTKSLEEQIELLKEREFLSEYWYVGY